MRSSIRRTRKTRVCTRYSDKGHNLALEITVINCLELHQQLSLGLLKATENTSKDQTSVFVIRTGSWDSVMNHFQPRAEHNKQNETRQWMTTVQIQKHTWILLLRDGSSLHVRKSRRNMKPNTVRRRSARCGTRSWSLCKDQGLWVFVSGGRMEEG